VERAERLAGLCVSAIQGALIQAVNQGFINDVADSAPVLGGLAGDEIDPDERYRTLLRSMIKRQRRARSGRRLRRGARFPLRY